MATAIAHTGMAAASVQVQAAREYSSDNALVARIAAGDQTAMRYLFARHQTSIYRWLLRIVRNEALAEDLLSEVFIDVWRQAGAFEGRSSVSTWLFAIARYKALSARRRRRDDPLDDRLVNSICDPSKDAETMLQEKDRDEALVVALNKLSDASRDHRSRLLSRQVGERGCSDHRPAPRHGKDTNVLRAQETRPSGEEALCHGR
jgi:RNA polymerase sigma-70 factor (ECF subfamily)